MSRASNGESDRSTPPSTGGGEPAPGQRGARPSAITLISVIVLLEAIALLGVAAWYVYELFTSTPASFGGAIFTLALLIAISVSLLAVSHFLYRGYRWTRSAALVWQLFMLTIAVPTLGAGLVLLGLALLVPPLLVLLLLFDKRTIAFASRRGGEPPAL